MKAIVVVLVAVMMIGACSDDDTTDDTAPASEESAQDLVCQQYEDLGAEPSDAELDALVTTAESSDDPELIDEVTAAVAEIRAGDDGGEAAEALATTCL